MIKRLLRLSFQTRRGSTLVMVAVAMPALLGMVALAVDLGGMFAAHAEAQRAADAAALAGASAYQDIGTNPPATAETMARARAMDYATQHYIFKRQVQPADVNIEFLPDEWKVRVTVRRQDVPTWFARVFGVNSVPIAARAAAKAAPATSTTECVKPFAIPDLWLNDENNDIGAPPTWADSANNVMDYYNGQGEIWNFDDGANQESYMSATSGFTINGATEPTGWGTDARNGIVTTDPETGLTGKYYNDQGRLVPIKLQQAGNSATPSYWYPWVLPGSQPGAADYLANIRTCNRTPLTIGHVYEVESKTGLMPQPTYRALMDLINQDSRNLEWRAQVDADGVVRGNVYDADTGALVLESPRFVTIGIFRPDDQDQGKQYMTFVQFAKVFLEKPASFKDDVVGRFLGYAPGGGGVQQGSLLLEIKLVE